MSLPFSRDETATPASPISSNLANKLQDCVIGAKHGTITSWKRAQTATLLTNATVSATKIAANADGCLIDGLDVGSFPEGTTIVGGEVLLFGTAIAQDAVVNVQLNKVDGTQALLLTVTIHNPPAAWVITPLALDGAFSAGHVMAAGETLSGTVSFPKSTAAVGSVGITIART